MSFTLSYPCLFLPFAFSLTLGQLALFALLSFRRKPRLVTCLLLLALTLLAFQPSLLVLPLTCVLPLPRLIPRLLSLAIGKLSRLVACLLILSLALRQLTRLLPRPLLLALAIGRFVACLLPCLLLLALGDAGLLALLAGGCLLPCPLRLPLTVRRVRPCLNLTRCAIGRLDPRLFPLLAIQPGRLLLTLTIGKLSRLIPRRLVLSLPLGKLPGLFSRLLLLTLGEPGLLALAVR